MKKYFKRVFWAFAFIAAITAMMHSDIKFFHETNDLDSLGHYALLIGKSILYFVWGIMWHQIYLEDKPKPPKNDQNPE